MTTAEQACQQMQSILERSRAEHRLYERRPVLSYDDAELARQVTGRRRR